MFKSIVLLVAAVVVFATVSNTSAATSKVGKIIAVSTTTYGNGSTEGRFEFAIEGHTLSGKQIRCYVHMSTAGAEKYRQMYSMVLTAFSTRENVWVGGSDPVANTANYPANNLPGAYIGDICIQR